MISVDVKAKGERGVEGRAREKTPHKVYPKYFSPTNPLRSIVSLNPHRPFSEQRSTHTHTQMYMVSRLELV